MDRIRRVDNMDVYSQVPKPYKSHPKAHSFSGFFLCDLVTLCVCPVDEDSQFVHNAWDFK